MSSMCTTYSTSRTYYRLTDASRGKPAPYYNRRDDTALTALFALFSALVAVVYIAQIV